MKKNSYLILLLLLNISITQACSCIIYDGYEKDIYKNSELIFVGKSINQNTLSIGDDADPFLSNDTKIDFNITEIIKGEQKDLISIRSNNRTSCGVSTQTGEEYLIFTNKNAKEEYTVGTCNILPLSNADNILQSFKQLKNANTKYDNIKKLIIALIIYIKQVCLSYIYGV